MLFQKQIDLLIIAIDDLMNDLAHRIADELEQRTLTVKIEGEPPAEPPEPPKPKTHLIEVTDETRLYYAHPDYPCAERMVLKKDMIEPKIMPGERFTVRSNPVPVDSSCGDSYAWSLVLGKNDVSFRGNYLPRNVCKKV